jgi:methylmalonyl-CoA/ethylmalonyl-CoA epimerase
MTVLRRLDHVAFLVRDTETALAYYRDHLGLRVSSSEDLDTPRVRLTYLDAGNAWIQLVEPLDQLSAAAASLAEHGEGLHHVCFGVDDVPFAALTLSDEAALPVSLGHGRNRPSAFVPGEPRHGARIEVTAFDHAEDVVRSAGWLGPEDAR